MDIWRGGCGAFLKAAVASGLAAWAWAGAAWGDETPRVVVTIKPIHSLVAGVMKGIAEPRLLLQGGASPHAYALKPSEAQALQDAGVVVRVSETLESFLNRPIANLAAEARIVTLADTPGLVLYAPREGGVWEAHAHEQEPDHGHEHEKDHPHEHKQDHRHAHGQTHKEDPGTEKDHEQRHAAHDPHLWLDPVNARIIVGRLAQELSRRYPGHAAAFARNAAALDTRLDRLDAELRASMAPLKDALYVVFHDAYRYFEERYGLSPAGSITVSPERPPGARRLAAIRKRIRATGKVCVFAEPQFEPRLVKTLIANTGARRGTLDPLGADLAAGETLYFTLMRNLAAGLKACLAPLAQK